MRAVRLFLRARAVIKYVLRAASTLKNTDVEQRDLSLLKRNVLLQVIRRSLFDQSQQLPANSALLAMMSNYVTYPEVCLSAVNQVNAREDPKLSNPTLLTHHGKKLKVTRLSRVVTLKVLSYINILRKCEQRGIYTNKHFEIRFQWLANQFNATVARMQVSRSSHSACIFPRVLRFVVRVFYQESEHASNSKILRSRAGGHSSKFCEQFEQSPNFASTFKFNAGTIQYPL